MQYSKILVFHKHTNLLPYFYSKYNGKDITEERYLEIKRRYTDYRDVQLFLLVRYDDNKTICRIKCPINPMPVKGEFEAVSIASIFDFFASAGLGTQRHL